MKELIEKNKKIVFAMNIIIAFIVFTKFKLESSTIEGHIGSFVGYNIMLLIYVIYKKAKERPIDVWVFTILAWIPILLMFFQEWQESLFK